MPLDLAARRLRNALDGHDLSYLKAGVLIDEPRDLSGHFQEVGEVAAVQDENDEFVGLRPGPPSARDDDLAELEPLGALRDRFQVLRVVVLSVDENNLFRPPGNIQRTLVDEPEIPGAPPAV